MRRGFDGLSRREASGRPHPDWSPLRGIAFDLSAEGLAIYGNVSAHGAYLLPVNVRSDRVARRRMTIVGQRSCPALPQWEWGLRSFCRKPCEFRQLIGFDIGYRVIHDAVATPSHHIEALA
jgi:hypothetical protein